MTASRKQPGVAFWATVVVVIALVAYPLSFGPACWANGRTHVGDQAFLTAYRPIVWAFPTLSPAGQRAVRWYVDLWLPAGTRFVGRADGVWFVHDVPVY